MMMTVPMQLQKYPEVDLKLGIKSSLPNPKATLALAILLWEVSDGKATIQYAKELSSGDIQIADDLKDKLISGFTSIYSPLGISDAEFTNIINQNQLFKSQLEALIVSFSLVWRLALIGFIDNKPVSTERTGRKRYEKQITYTKNIDILHIAMKSQAQEFYQVLLNWIGIDKVRYNKEVENDLLMLLLNFSEEAVFKLQDGDGNDVVFNNLGIYDSLLNGDSAVDVKGTSEPKGSLRVLRSALHDKMAPIFDYSERDGVSIDAQYSLNELKNYSERVNAFLSLSNSKHLKITQSEQLLIPVDSTKSPGKNILLYGVPGSGKSHTIKTQYCNDYTHMEKVVFHPDYMNTDFVGQILPTVKNDGAITYDFVPGPFTRIVKKAFENPTETYYLVIEEINRGNAPAIFGEIFQLLDRDESGKSTYAITNNMIAEAVFSDPEEPVFIPSNLWILATMNTADQNVFTLDTAFQRRWDMKMIKNDVSQAVHAKTQILDTGISWESFCNQINQQILASNTVTLSSEDKRLGSYFITQNVLQPEDDSEKSLFAEKVIKYLWDDAFKFNRENIFAEKFNSLEQVIEEFSTKKGFSRFNIFSEDVQALLRATLDSTENQNAEDASQRNSSNED